MNFGPQTATYVNSAFQFITRLRR